MLVEIPNGFYLFIFSIAIMFFGKTNFFFNVVHQNGIFGMLPLPVAAMLINGGFIVGMGHNKAYFVDCIVSKQIIQINWNLWLILRNQGFFLVSTYYWYAIDLN